MTPELWGKLKPLFFNALDQPPENRKQFLSEQCGDDVILRSELEALLEAELRDEPLFNNSVAKLLMRDEYLSPRQAMGGWIGPYRVLAPLGAGGMGTIYKAMSSDGRLVALKIIGNEEDISASVSTRGMLGKKGARDRSRRIGLVREARFAMGLKHPNIVQVIDYGQHRSVLFIVMEFLSGQSLAQAMRDSVCLTLARKLQIVIEVCNGVSFAHRNGVLHRDIKPANIFLLEDGTVKVLDFGIAIALTTKRNRDVTLAGTLPYVAPELLRREGSLDERSDVWSIGVVLRDLVRNEVAYPEAYCPATLADLRGVIDRALAHDPSARTAAPGLLGAELRSILNQLGENNGVSPALEAGAMSVASFIPTGSAFRRTDTPIRVRTGVVRVREWRQQISNLQAEVWTLNFISLCSLSWLMAGHLYNDPPKQLLLFMGGVCLAPFVLKHSAVFALGVAEAFLVGSRCKSCRCHMKHRQTVTRFALNDEAVRFAFSDCVAALGEGLWEDAIKLLSIHSLDQEPLMGNTLISPPIRFHLSFFECDQCDHSSAILTQEYREEARWIAQSKFSEAYRGNGRAKEESGPYRSVLTAASFYARSLILGLRSLSVTPIQAVWISIGMIFMCLVSMYR